MQRWTYRWTLAVVGLIVLSAALPARALVVAPPPGPMRAGQADVIVVGRVVAHEERDMMVTPFPGSKDKVAFRIAVVNVVDNLRGAKGMKTVRIGFEAPMENNPNPPKFIRPGLGRRGPSLEVGQDGLFFLTRHSSGQFLTAPMFFDVVARTAPNFEKEVGDIRKACKLLDEPIKGLKAESQDDRFLTATLLINQYRRNTSPMPKTEQIPAEESKLILKALAEGNWAAQPRFGQNHPWNMFSQLGLTEKDGWKQPQAVKTVNDLYSAAQEWLKTNADTYRIVRFVNTPPAAKLEEK